MQLILIFLLMFFMSFVVIFLALPPIIYILLAGLMLVFGKNPIFAILLVGLAVYKYKNGGNIRFESNFRRRNNFNFDYEDFNRYQKQHNYTQNRTSSRSEYVNACNILGVDENMSFEEKKKVYRKLQRKYHPDINHEANAEEMSKRINDAWDIIEKYEK